MELLQMEPLPQLSVLLLTGSRTPKNSSISSFEYGRYGEPNHNSCRKQIRFGGESTILMSSGMCASTVMMFALVKKGGHIITTTDCYRKTRISLPLMCDIELVSKLCHSKGTLVCVDGTFATPLNQNALALGADLVLTGCISGSEEVTSKIHKLHHVLGGTLNPNYTNALCYLNAAYLVIQDMNTLHLHAQQQNIIGLRIAEILEVKRVHYTGLPSHPEHKIAMKQMTTFIDALKIPYISLSFGGCESIVDQPAIMSYWYV
ncbi:hypothetical protein MKW92_027879 [Papaver armeniacum]|nr:hypothetical protein MKW92_027879 [Papaver armeniacum]